MKKILNNDSLSLLGLFLVIMFWVPACTRPENEVGLDIQPEGDVLHTYYTDTVSIHTSGVTMDSLKSSGTSSVVLGNYYDHIFGHTRASIFAQLRLSTNGLTAPEIYEVDSVVLAMVYTGRIYGKNVPQFYGVYEMTDTLAIHPDSNYYTNSVIGFESLNLVEPGQEWNDTDLAEKFVEGDDTLTAQLRIRLRNELGERFFEADPDSIGSNTMFRQYFEGLHIRTESDDAACVNYDLDNSASRMTIYYRDLSGTEPDTLSYVFSFGSLSKKFSSFEHEYTPARLYKFDSYDTIPDQQHCYVQAGAGMMTKVEFPDLYSYVYSGRAVNIANLVVPLSIESDEHCCEPQELLLLYGVANDGSREILPYDWEVNMFYEKGKNQYSINIAKYVQDVINGTRMNNGLYLVSAGGAVTVNRVVLNGPEFSVDDTAQNMHLELAFSN